jgi:hypothetical protein
VNEKFLQPKKKFVLKLIDYSAFYVVLFYSLTLTDFYNYENDVVKLQRGIGENRLNYSKYFKIARPALLILWIGSNQIKVVLKKCFR